MSLQSRLALLESIETWPSLHGAALERYWDGVDLATSDEARRTGALTGCWQTLTYYGVEIMPVIKKPKAPESPRHHELVKTLIAELKRNEATGPATAPKIIEEEQRGSYLRVTVIWDEWRDVDPENRGRIIMDAYERQRPNDVGRITAALGLTHADAERLGIAV